MATTTDRRAAAGFAEAWDEFVLAIRRAQARAQQAPEELTLAQYYLLGPLAGGERLPLCDLADSAGIAAPTATRIVDGLERCGLVRRERSTTDRRVVLVSLTEQGRKRVARKRRQLGQRRQRVYEALEPGEREQSERLLRHLAELVGQL
jgi:MarR family transcriptional regulator, organic hydroperoxide resistance regulator